MIKTILGSVAILIAMISLIFSRYEDKMNGKRWWNW